MIQEVYDPLADAPPPRYAIESDDEDEYNSSSRPFTQSERPPGTKVEFKSIRNVPCKSPLIFASGEAGASWAKIVNLGEQHAGIYVNDLLVGLLFCPPWTSAVVVLSEAETLTQLPLFAMTAYTTAIVDHLQPSSVALLDSYPTKVYISSRVISQDSAPIRYLSIGEKPIPDSKLESFTPPNLLQSTAASLLNELYLRSISDEDRCEDAVTAILLPSPKIPRLPPTFNGGGVSGDLADTNWDREMLERAHKWLFMAIGEVISGPSLCAHAEAAIRQPDPAGSGLTRRSALGEIGEGGMYI